MMTDVRSRSGVMMRWMMILLVISVVSIMWSMEMMVIRIMDTQWSLVTMLWSVILILVIVLTIPWCLIWVTKPGTIIILAEHSGQNIINKVSHIIMIIIVCDVTKSVTVLSAWMLHPWISVIIVVRFDA